MKIKCVKCKLEFEQKNYERNCGCNLTKNYRITTRKPNLSYTNYMSNLRINFKNPIKQWYMEFISTESMPYGSTLKKVVYE